METVGSSTSILGKGSGFSLSAIVSPTGQETLIPVQVYSCGNCGKVAEGFLEGSGLEEELKSDKFPSLDI